MVSSKGRLFTDSATVARLFVIMMSQDWAHNLPGFLGRIFLPLTKDLFVTDKVFPLEACAGMQDVKQKRTFCVNAIAVNEAATRNNLALQVTRKISDATISCIESQDTLYDTKSVGYRA